MSEFDSFVSQAWAEHAERPADVAARLAHALPLVENDDHVSRLAHLAHHVLGEHLHQWPEGLDFLQRLEARGVHGEASVAAFARYRAALQMCVEGVCGVDEFGESDQCRVMAMAAGNLATVDAPRAAILLEGALARSGRLPDKDPGVRSLAGFANGIAASLQDLPDRSPGQRALMLHAAEVARSQWERAGTWLEVERAEYRLSVCWCAAGEAQRGLDHALACEASVRGHDSPPLELFFAAEALAIAKRALGDGSGADAAVATARAAFAALPQDEQGWCRGTLEKLASR